MADKKKTSATANSTKSEASASPASMSDADKSALVKSTRRFDLRRILGALFVVYGIILTIIGIVNYSSDISRTKGIAINLWTGVSMLVLAGLFFLWDRLAPVPEEDIVRNLEQQGEEREIGEGKEVS